MPWHQRALKWWSQWTIQVCLIRGVSVSLWILWTGSFFVECRGESLQWGCCPCIWGDNGILSLYLLMSDHLTTLPSATTENNSRCCQTSCGGKDGSHWESLAQFLCFILTIVPNFMKLIKEWVLLNTFNLVEKSFFPTWVSNWSETSLVKRLGRGGNSRRSDRVYWPPLWPPRKQVFLLSVDNFIPLRESTFFFFLPHQVTCWSK